MMTKVNGKQNSIYFLFKDFKIVETLTIITSIQQQGKRKTSVSACLTSRRLPGHKLSN